MLATKIAAAYNAWLSQPGLPADLAAELIAIQDDEAAITDCFYRDLAEDPGAVGVPLVPDMYHNTILELMAVGGLVATIPYVIHRVHTVISFIKNPNENRFYVALTLFALLILSLLDNHIFYILPTLFYTFLTAVLIKSENGNESVLVDFKR